jgi:hypothetical protein
MWKREGSERYCGRKGGREGWILHMNGEEWCVEFGGIHGNEGLEGGFMSE